MDDPQEHKEKITAQIDRILGDPLFRGAKRSSSFLRYVSNCVLNGESYKIKEFSIAVDAFGLETTFDQQIDPRIRVEAKRLRDRLNQYYEGPGLHDSVLVEIPKGSYIPEFRFSSEPEVPDDHVIPEPSEDLTILIDRRFRVDVFFSASDDLQDSSQVKVFQSHLIHSLFERGGCCGNSMNLTEMSDLQSRGIPLILEIRMIREKGRIRADIRIKMKPSGMLIMNSREIVKDEGVTEAPGLTAEQQVEKLLDYFRSLK